MVLLLKMCGYLAITMFIGTILYYPTAKVIFTISDNNVHTKNLVLVSTSLIVASFFVFMFFRIKIS